MKTIQNDTQKKLTGISYMKITIGIFFFIFLIFNWNCIKKEDKQDCNINKIDLLINEILQKRYLVRNITSSPDEDSSFKYNYLHLENITLPKNNYYLKIGKGYDPDSVRLILKDNSLTKHNDANSILLKINEINIDSTKINITISYSSSNHIALVEGIFNYSFDRILCKWNLKDSVIKSY